MMMKMGKTVRYLRSLVLRKFSHELSKRLVSFILYCIVLFYFILYCIELYCIVLYCIVLYCVVLYWIVLYHIICFCSVEYRILLNCIRILFYPVLSCTTFRWYSQMLSLCLSVCLRLNHPHITSLDPTLLPSHTSFFSSLILFYLTWIFLSFCFFSNSVLCQQMASRLYDGIRTSIHGSRSYPLDDRTISTNSRESTIFHFCYW